MNSLPQTICLVEDDEAVRDSMCALLESHGVTVDAYPRPSALLTAGPHPCDCLILDYHMPEMDGLQLLSEIRKQGLGAPAILMTGRGDPQLVSRALQAGVHAMLNKPVDETVLLQSIRDAIRCQAKVAQRAI
ncbi:MAG TPA: response regulator [Micropepsaceae bacterium]|nr:response regulator [Micropepsaceae bacterium]